MRNDDSLAAHTKRQHQGNGERDNVIHGQCCNRHYPTISRNGIHYTFIPSFEAQQISHQVAMRQHVTFRYPRSTPSVLDDSDILGTHMRWSPACSGTPSQHGIHTDVIARPVITTSTIFFLQG